MPWGWTEDNEEKRRCMRCCSEISRGRRRSAPRKRHLPVRRKTQFSRASISAGILAQLVVDKKEMIMAKYRAIVFKRRKMNGIF